MEKTIKIGLNNRGTYNASEEYDVLDFVSANNAIYISLQSGNVGHALTEADWWECSIQGFDETALDGLIGEHLSGYQFGGIANPDDDYTPTTAKTFFIAYKIGLYKDYGEVVVEDNTKATLIFHDGEGNWSTLLTELRTSNGSSGSGCCCCVTKEELENTLKEYIKKGDVTVDTIDVNTILTLN